MARRSDARFPVEVVPKGSNRAHVHATRKLRTVSPVENPNTREQAKAEIQQTIPVFDVEAGRAELAMIHTVARLNEEATSPRPPR